MDAIVKLLENSISGIWEHMKGLNQNVEHFKDFLMIGTTVRLLHIHSYFMAIPA